MLKLTLTIAFVIALHASAAGAQPPSDRATRSVATNAVTGYVEVNLGLQATSSAFDATIHPLTFVEPATVQTSYSVARAREFDFGGGVRLAQNLAVGGSFSRFQKTGNGTVAALVPHPFFFSRLRTVSGTATDLTRQETGLHGKLVWTSSMGDGWEVSLSGGPSIFKIEQDLVDDITISQTYPFDTAAFASAVATRHSASGFGFNVGADVTRLVTPHMGVGVALVISRARLTLDATDDTTMTVDAGGARIGGGLRFRF